MKPTVFIAALVPAGWLVWAALTGTLGANPLGEITNTTGDWTLRFLCLTLAVTPLRRLTGWNGVVKFRRMLGLFAFFYATLHLLTYVLLDRLAGLDAPGWRALTAALAEDVLKRPFILVGFTAFAVMAPLAATSTAGMIRRLGGRRWQALHRLMYVSCVAAVVHYWWLVKIDIRRPMAYGAVVAALFAMRIYWRRRSQASASRRMWRREYGRPVPSSGDPPTTTNPSAS